MVLTGGGGNVFEWSDQTEDGIGSGVLAGFQDDGVLLELTQNRHVPRNAVLPARDERQVIAIQVGRILGEERLTHSVVLPESIPAA